MFRRLTATLTALLAAAFFALVLGGCSAERHVAGPDAIGASAAPSGPLEADLARLVAADDDALASDDHRPGVSISGPTVITEPGVYRVTRDFSVDATTGDGIVIRSSNVLLFLGDHTLRGPGDKLGRAIVVDGAEHVLVQGGRLRTFGLGVALVNASHSAVRGVRIEGADAFADPANGIAPQIGVMLVNSRECRIARNELDGVNLGLFVRGGGSRSNDLRWNQVRGGAHGLLGVCYNPAPGGDPAGPSNDRVAFNSLRRFGKGIQASAGSTSNRFVSNTIEYFSVDYEDFNGSNVFKRNRSTQVTP